MTVIDDNIWVLLGHLCKAQRNLAEAEFSKMGLHVGQEQVLFSLIDNESLAQSDLINQLCVEPPTVTKMLQRMEKSGLVERRQDAQDGRVSRVNATEQGKSLQQPMLDICVDMEARMLANMTVTEQMLLRRLLMQALSNLTESQTDA